MKDRKVQQRECGVSFEPVLDVAPPMVAVDYTRPFQLLTLDELRRLDENLHDAYRRAYLAEQAARARLEGVRA